MKDLEDEILDGISYEFKPQKVVKKDDVYQVHSIFCTRIGNDRKQYLVSWKIYLSKSTCWVVEKRACLILMGLTQGYLLKQSIQM